MKIIKIHVYIILISNLVNAQINYQILNDVSDSFKQDYFSKSRNYNPLQVGNVWQYYFSDFTVPFYVTTKVIKDSLVNNKHYFKKLYYQTNRNSSTLNFISWERNDSISGVSFMLDFQDVNDNGDSLDELPLDSLENPWYTEYRSYKYSFPNPNFFLSTKVKKTVLVEDSNWVLVENDTLLSRNIEIGELFWGETIIDQFGIISFFQESPERYCTGAIVDSRNYGTIVAVEAQKMQLPNEIVLENNYPNPFNPTTFIEYSIPNQTFITLELFDVLGKKIKTLVNEYKTSGRYSYKLDMSNYANGIYFIP